MKEFIAAGSLLVVGTFLLVSVERTTSAQETPAAAVAAENETAGFDGASYERPDDEEVRRRLTELQYRVTRQEATEPPFRNAYWDNKEAGIYVDVVSGEALFSSVDKYRSGTGWPSFSRPLAVRNIVEKEDRGWFSVRTEVRSHHADSHLGHVFEDGPEPTGLRYCINSAALRFVPRADLEIEGYAEYLDLFSDEDEH